MVVFNCPCSILTIELKAISDLNARASRVSLFPFLTFRRFSPKIFKTFSSLILCTHQKWETDMSDIYSNFAIFSNGIHSLVTMRISLVFFNYSFCTSSLKWIIRLCSFTGKGKTKLSHESCPRSRLFTGIK